MWVNPSESMISGRGFEADMVRGSAVRCPSSSRSRSRPEIGVEFEGSAFSAGSLSECCWLVKEFVVVLATLAVILMRRDGGDDAGEEEIVVVWHVI